VCADLPSLLAADLDTALGVADAATTPAFVADEDGVGTTLYTSPLDAFSPRFGSGSRKAHLEAGAREIVGELSSLRRDVDDAEGLAAAVDLGLGAHTRSVLLT
jgi:2-phospho-L-lactate guanylyltransferase